MVQRRADDKTISGRPASPFANPPLTPRLCDRIRLRSVRDAPKASRQTEDIQKTRLLHMAPLNWTATNSFKNRIATNNSTRVELFNLKNIKQNLKQNERCIKRNTNPSNPTDIKDSKIKLCGYCRRYGSKTLFPIVMLSKNCCQDNLYAIIRPSADAPIPLPL